jgi:membrane-bound inhibitor of C-type lysozyme
VGIIRGSPPHLSGDDAFIGTAPDGDGSSTGDVKMFQDKGISRSATMLLAAGLFVAAGCASEKADDQASPETTAQEGGAAETNGEMKSPHGQVSVIMFNCADEKSFTLTVAAGVGKAALRTEDGVFQLDQQEVASGMEYSDGSYTFRGKGSDAFVEKDGERIFTDCMAAGHPDMPETADAPETPED